MYADVRKNVEAGGGVGVISQNRMSFRIDQLLHIDTEEGANGVVSPYNVVPLIPI